MRLTELEPRWLLKDGRRIGIAFKCPNPARRKWWVTCLTAPTPFAEQEAAVIAAGIADTNWQGCEESVGWTFAGGIENAAFETLSISPSLDGGPYWWHGNITNGEVV